MCVDFTGSVIFTTKIFLCVGKFVMKAYDNIPARQHT